MSICLSLRQSRFVCASATCISLGIEFYLFVSHGGMNDRGYTCKFRISQSAFSKFTRRSSVFHTSMRNKHVEFNPYIYTLSKLSCFGYEISVFKYTTADRAVFRTAAGAAGSYVTATVLWKNGCQNFSYVHPSRKHWKCKY